MDRIKKYENNLRKSGEWSLTHEKFNWRNKIGCFWDEIKSRQNIKHSWKLMKKLVLQTN